LNAVVRLAIKRFMPIQVKQENIALKSVTAYHAERKSAMTSEKLQQIAAYKVTVIILRKLLDDGTITEKEFRKTESNIAEKCGLSLCSIYREIA
jgi:hypothetical protein